MVLAIIAIICVSAYIYITSNPPDRSRVIYFYYFSDNLDNTSIHNINTNIENQSIPLYLKDYDILTNLSLEKLMRHDKDAELVIGMLKYDQNINLIFNKTGSVSLEKGDDYLCKYIIMAQDHIQINSEHMYLHHYFFFVGKEENVTNLLFVTNVMCNVDKSEPDYEEFSTFSHEKAYFHIMNICNAFGININKEDISFEYYYF